MNYDPKLLDILLFDRTTKRNIIWATDDYLVSRYDTVSGAMIPIKNRIGLLDRKLRVVNENTGNAED